jgi:L-lactate dehydrogenase
MIKIGIIGSGSVGGAIARDLMFSGIIDEIVMLDSNMSKAQAVAEDLTHASVFMPDVEIKAGNYSNLKNSDIVIITAGANQKPGETRNDLVVRNTKIMIDIIPQLMKVVNKDKVIIVPVSNPLDVITQVITALSGLPQGRVVGTGTMLDSARFVAILAKYLGVSKHSVNAYVLGEHGDSSVLNWSEVTVGNIPLLDFCRQMKIPMTVAVKKTIEHRVRNAAYSIIKGRVATWDGIGAAATELVKTIVKDEKRIFTVSNVVRGFLAKPVAFSVPRIIGRSGVVASLMPKMSENEKNALRKSAAVILSNYELVA